MKKFRGVLIIAIVTVFLCGCSSGGTKEIVEIPITLDNWEEYFELKSRTKVINEERRIKEAEILYGIFLKEEYQDKVVTDTETEIKMMFEYKTGRREITFVEGKNEIAWGELISLSSPYIEERSIYNKVFEDIEFNYETKDMISHGVQTKEAETSIETLEEFKMLEIEGNIYLYNK